MWTKELVKRKVWRVMALPVVLGIGTGCSQRTIDLRGDITTCEVHGEALNEDTVSVLTGLVHYPMNYYEARATEFPNANDRAEGPYLSYDQAVVLYCSQCRAAKSVWQAVMRTQAMD